MKPYLAFLGVVCLTAAGWGSTYYVDSAGGSDSNNGTSQQTPWKTVAKVNAATLAAGDSVLFKRGGVWTESLAPTASGAAGSPISFDAYGAGPAPLLTGYLGLPAASWTLSSGNVWKATVTASLPIPPRTFAAAPRSRTASLVKRDIRVPVGWAWK